jgi:hypothetical protein
MTAPIIKLSQLSAASALTGTEAVPVVQGGLTKGAHTINIPIALVLFAGNNGSLFVRR